MIIPSKAPSYRYNGYRYVPDCMQDSDGFYKAIHYVYRVEDIDPNAIAQEPSLPEFSCDASTYKFLDYEEFTYYVDMFKGGSFG